MSDECLCSSKRSDFTKAGSPRICGVAACVARLTRGRACIHNLVIYMDDAPRSWQSKQTHMRSWIYCRMSSSSCAGVKAWTVLEDKQTACCHLYDRCQCLRLIWNCILVQATTQAPRLNAIIKAGAFPVFGLLKILRPCKSHNNIRIDMNIRRWQRHTFRGLKWGAVTESRVVKESCSDA